MLSAATTNLAPVLTAGCTLEVLKGANELWVTSTTGRPAHYARVNVREKLRVVEATVVEDRGMRVVLERPHQRVTLWISSGAKTRHPEFNLNTGNPAKAIRVRVSSRPAAQP